MKIWIINHDAIPPSYGGLVRHFYFSKYLQQKGHIVNIFTSSKIHNSDINMIQGKELYLNKNIDGVDYTFIRSGNYKSNGVKRILSMLQFATRLWRVCTISEKPDIIYTSSPDLLTAVSATLLAKKLKVKKVVEIRDLWPESIVAYHNISRKNIVIQGLYVLEKWLYKNADKLIFTMPGGKDYISEKGWEKRIKLDKIYQVNNGIDMEEAITNQQKYAFSDIDLDDMNSFKVIYTGSIRRADNLWKVVECAEILREKNSKIKILVWGDGDEKRLLKEYVSKQKLNNIVFKDRVEKKYIPYILSKADVNLMHFQYSELMRFGLSANKLFDYLASGKIILSSLKTKYDLILQNCCGIVVENDTVEELADKLLFIEKMTEDERKVFGENARNLAWEYDYSKLTQKVEEILYAAYQS